QEMNDKVLPALYAIGILQEEGLSFQYDQVEDIAELWERTKEVLPYKDVEDQWLIDKFGIKVIGNREVQQNKLGLNFSEHFFD
ncbi:MAG: hypothetical protein KBA33_08360, partial [Cloacibacterium sp.]|nr:hypothetical protein [Cloacibacterium sp.]